MQLVNDSFPHRNVVVGAVEAHVVDVADQPQTLWNADARCTRHQRRFHFGATVRAGEGRADNCYIFQGAASSQKK